MPSAWDKLLWGPLASDVGCLPLLLDVILCDLRPRMLAKCRVGKGYRAISRNGRILLAAPAPLEDWAGQPTRLRLQVWHKAILPGDRLEPFGLLMSLRKLETIQGSMFKASLLPQPGENFALALDLGGNTVMEFRRT
ncbi:MAG: hypothetical protein ACJ8FY_06390 [Gemmataceae bacterium]